MHPDVETNSNINDTPITSSILARGHMKESRRENLVLLLPRSSCLSLAAGQLILQARGNEPMGVEENRRDPMRVSDGEGNW